MVSRLWAYIKEHNLQDPKDKRVILFGEQAVHWQCIGSTPVYQCTGVAAPSCLPGWAAPICSAAAFPACLPVLPFFHCPVSLPCPPLPRILTGLLLRGAQACRQPVPAPSACLLPALPCPASPCADDKLQGLFPVVPPPH